MSTDSSNKEQIRLAPPLSVKLQRFWTASLRAMRSNPPLLAGVVIIGAIYLVAIFADVIVTEEYERVKPMQGFLPPAADHWFGTDDHGRDVFVRVLVGGGISLAGGFLATAVSLVIGVTYGSIAGYLGGRTDAFLMRIVDILYALPFVIFVILLMVLFGRNFILMFIAIGAVEWLTMARIVRAQVMALKNTEFVEAARALGYSDMRIIFVHLLPNMLGPITVSYTHLTLPTNREV